MRTRGHGMWGEEAPARPSAAHARGGRSQERCERAAMGCGVKKRQPVPPPRTAAAGTAHAAAAVHRNAANARPWDVGWGSASPSRSRRTPAAIVHRNDANARPWARAAANAAMAVRPGGSGRSPAAAARPLPRPHGASLKVPRQRAKTARGRRIRRSRACHSHCLRAVCVSPASRAPGAPCSRSPHRRSRRARRSRPAPATARWYGNGS